MAFTQGQLEALEKAYAAGVLEVEYQGRRVRYQSMDAMRTAITTIKNDLAAQSGKRVRLYRFGSRKGL